MTLPLTLLIHGLIITYISDVASGQDDYVDEFISPIAQTSRLNAQEKNYQQGTINFRDCPLMVHCKTLNLRIKKIISALRDLEDVVENSCQRQVIDDQNYNPYNSYIPYPQPLPVMPAYYPHGVQNQALMQTPFQQNSMPQRVGPRANANPVPNKKTKKPCKNGTKAAVRLMPDYSNTKTTNEEIKEDANKLVTTSTESSSSTVKT